MKEFKVQKNLLPYIEAVLKRRHVDYSLEEGIEEDEAYIATGISGMQFHRVVTRASCEKSCDEMGTDLLILAKSEIKNPSYLRFLLKEAGTTSYAVFN